ncbi:hypothetical protein GOP47_0003133 [Adiantum capillus-veneris]|uniref:Uncharacterized protein n=1 Tax=Adiantum capillus-veneris TaxID=13818 RepID=A0A9D4VC85_ADICA|nr:hypothetical protein GOP47_0003133 [Adiantum capillus-veneris]
MRNFVQGLIMEYRQKLPIRSSTKTSVVINVSSPSHETHGCCLHACGWNMFCRLLFLRRLWFANAVYKVPDFVGYGYALKVMVCECIL